MHILTVLTLFAASAAAAQPCTPAFSDAYAGGDMNGSVNAVAVFDDGTGPALYVGGNFTVAGGVACNHLARWKGSGWAPVGAGVNGAVNALCVHDEDGDGPIPPALYIGGSFTLPQGPQFRGVVRWNGTMLGQVAGGTNGGVNALLSVVDHGATTLYVGGSFNQVGNGALPVAYIARLSAGAWSAMGSGMGSTVNALAAYDEGNGSVVFAAGTFGTAGGSAAPGIARWDGAAWSAVGGGLTGGDVKALQPWSGGLYATGNFLNAGGSPASRIARWNGAAWAPVGTGFNAAGLAIGSYRGRLIVSGTFTTAGGSPAARIAAFDGSTWSALGSGLSGNGGAIGEWDFGDGAEMVVGGAFATAGGVGAADFARWNDLKWRELGRGATGAAYAIGMHRSEVIVGGDFTRIGGVDAPHIAAFDGRNFRTLGDGLNAGARAVVSFDSDKDGPLPEALIAGGNFTATGTGASLLRLAQWDGEAWSQVSSGANGQVNSMVVFEDGGGPAVFLAGAFTTVGGTNALRVARWSGTTFAALGLGLNGTVNQLVAYNGSLFAVGGFTLSGSTTVNRIARWDGASWQPLDVGANNTITCATVFGGQLVVGGSFTSIGGVAAARLARWNGAAWSDVAGGADNAVQSLEVFSDGAGRGAALYVGGDFAHVGSPAVAALRVARFDGSRWSAIGAGASGTVSAMRGLTVDGESSLFVAGAFLSLDGVPSGRFGSLGACPEACYANCDLSVAAPILNANDFQCFLNLFAAGDAYANCDGSAAAPVLNANDFQCFLNSFAAGCP